MTNNSKYFPNLGFGLGLRIPHYQHIFQHWPQVDWFEIISENFMDTDGLAKRNLAKICEHYPVVMHGVALSIGTVDPLNSEYLQKLKKLAELINPAWISDHLCWTGVAHKNSHDLLPVPYTEEALKHIVARIKYVQDFLGRPIALENPSIYLEFKASHMSEVDFIVEMIKQSGCYLLLDVNNLYVNCYNRCHDSRAYIDALPLDKIIQIHLSGHSNMGTHIIDTHDDYVVDEVWALYRYVVHKAGRIPNTMIEWDDNIPVWDVLYAELEKAREVAKDGDSCAAFLSRTLDTEASYARGLLQDEGYVYIPSQLADVQHMMQAAILLGSAIDSKPEEWIRPKEVFSTANQLEVYVNAYRYRLYDVTAVDYPVLKHYLGSAAFDQLIKDFVNVVHSTHFNVARYAAHLPKFLAQHELSDNFALELASLENAVVQLMDIEETMPLELLHLNGVTPEILSKAVLYPRKASQLFAFDYPVNNYYRAVKENEAPALPVAEKSFLAVFRHDDVVWRMPLGEQEHYLLQELFSGVSVDLALQKLLMEFTLPAEAVMCNISTWFSRWMRNGLLSGVSIASNF